MWLGRQDLEDRERRTLARHAAYADDSGGRRAETAKDPFRTDFQRDRDRVIHSAAFRRLQHKTQVLAAFEGDHYRSRMTHSLEVAQMARAVAIALALNADLAETVALAHDLGHPPFGHVGEEGLHELMADHGGFRHNVQGVRIVDYLEDRYGHGHGLDLTLVVRRSLLKGTVPSGFPLSADLRQPAPTPLEARIVDLCDKIAYSCHDLDDGIRAGAFTVAEAQRLTLWQRAARRIGQAMVPKMVSEMVGLLIHDLVLTADDALASATAAPRLDHGAEARQHIDEAQAFLRERFYRSELVLSAMERGREQIRLVFDHLLGHPQQMPPAVQARIDHDGLHRTVCDYVSGMTDRYLVGAAAAAQGR